MRRREREAVEEYDAWRGGIPSASSGVGKPGSVVQPLAHSRGERIPARSAPLGALPSAAVSGSSHRPAKIEATAGTPPPPQGVESGHVGGAEQQAGERPALLLDGRDPTQQQESEQAGFHAHGRPVGQSVPPILRRPPKNPGWWGPLTPPHTPPPQFSGNPYYSPNPPLSTLILLSTSPPSSSIKPSYISPTPILPSSLPSSSPPFSSRPPSPPPPPPPLSPTFPPPPPPRYPPILTPFPPNPVVGSPSPSSYPPPPILGLDPSLPYHLLPSSYPNLSHPPLPLLSITPLLSPLPPP